MKYSLKPYAARQLGIIVGSFSKLEWILPYLSILYHSQMNIITKYCENTDFKVKLL